jgi:hypothetical protein
LAVLARLISRDASPVVLVGKLQLNCGNDSRKPVGQLTQGRVLD